MPDAQSPVSDTDVTAEIRRLLDQTLTLHQAGRLAEAEAGYRRVLALDPRDPNALTNLGTIMFQWGRTLEGIPYFEASLAAKPAQPNALSNLSHGLTLLGRFAEARDACEKAVALQPDNADAWNNLGNARRELDDVDGAVEAYERAIASDPSMITALGNESTLLRAKGRNEEAMAVLHRALAIDPFYVDAWNELGNCLQALGRHAESLTAYDECLKVRPDHVEALSNKGVALNALKRFDESIACCDRALALRPNYAEGWHNRGNALRGQKKFDEAMADFQRAVALKPELADAHNNIGIILHEQGQPFEALEAFDRAHALNPRLGEVHGNRANVLRELNRFDEALEEYDTAIAMKAGLRDAINNRAICLAEMGLIDQAIAGFDEAAALDPAFAEAPWNLGVLMLMLGQDLEGWRLYEKRWKRMEFDDKPNPYGKAPWLGERDIAGKVLLITAEQGIGDTLQMLRYIPLLADRGIKVVAAVQNPLVELARGIPGAAFVLGERQPIPPWDEFIPTMSLPLAFGGVAESYPRNTPYVSAPAPVKARWAERLGPRTRPRIGLVWSGSREHKNDRNRSIPLKTLAPLLDLDADFISLQIASPILNLKGEIKDFVDTAGIVENLDLMISVDTSVAHLVGALGKPLWLMLPFMPDFRWRLEGTETPWYPSARLWRQAGDRAWEPLVERMRAEAEAWLRTR
jgi:tetratricopeptide (TPR) repeat protein